MRRRRAAALVGATIVALLLACVASSWRDTASPKLAMASVPVRGLAREVRLLVVTDLQGATFGPRQRRVARLVGGRRFDAVVLGGDMIFDPGADLGPATDLVDVLAPTAPTIVSVRGNHDDAAIAATLAGRGVADLASGGPVRLPGGRPGGSIVLTGLRTVENARETSADILVVVDHVPPDDAMARELAAAPISADLFVAGHYHAGQFRLPLLGAFFIPPNRIYAKTTYFPEMRGMHVRGLAMQAGLAVFISPALGRWGLSGRQLPRVLNRAEITEVVLKPSG